MHCHVLSDHPLVYTLLNSNRVWVHKWLLSGEQHGLWEVLLRSPPQTEGEVKEQPWLMTQKVQWAHGFDHQSISWINVISIRLTLAPLADRFTLEKNSVKDINHCVKVCLTPETRINNPVFKISSCIIVSLCLFWFRIYSRWGKAFFASEDKKCAQMGAEGSSEATAKSERSRTHYPPASARANIPQRRQLVRNSFCLSLSHFPCHWVTFMNLNRQPSFPFMPPFSLCVCILSLFPGARVNGSRSNGIVGLYLSTSIATTAAVKGNRTQVTGTALCLLLYTPPLSCCRFYSSSWPISLSSSAFY